MSDKLMDTAPGGESDQYSAQQTFLNPHSSSSGQTSSSDSQTQPVSSSTYPTEGPDLSSATGDKEERGQRTAENMRYGQGISEQGVGGFTEGNSGSADQDVGYGGAEQDDGSGGAGGEGQSASDRTAQGYEGRESSDEIGA